VVSAGITLALDAAASFGTIAVLVDGVVTAERAVEMKSAGKELFFPQVLDVLREAGATPRDLARVVCGAGPGSFTALRVVGAIAKGLCEGTGRPLHGVPSLALIVAGHEGTGGGGRWLATLDAMRGDRYLALVTVAADGTLSSVESLGLAPGESVAARAAGLGATLIGPEEALAVAPHARGVARCWGLVEAAGAADLASWEPVYGRLAEAQVKWEAAHGRPLAADRIAT
jgi:tRNA threonylcarbamoyladenosine biosynthesis protein TsaB